MKLYPNLAGAIANTLESLRNEKRDEQILFGGFADIERCYLRDIEKGNRKPTVNTIFCLCEALQVDPIDFFKKVVGEIERLRK